jgi:DNA polymerase-3 subunit epsilon
VSSYTRLLNASLTNGRLSEHDSIALANLSCELGLSQHQCARIHESYVLEVAQALWEDGVPAKDDLDALAKIGQALSVRPSVIEQATRIDTNEHLTSAIPVITHAVDHAANAYHRLTLAEGDRLALTGSMSRRRSEWEEILRALGIAPQSAVTKATRVLVAADPDTESTKARKARAYQIPIVDEPWLERAVSDGIDASIAD